MMTPKQEAALRQALEALKASKYDFESPFGAPDSGEREVRELKQKAIAAIDEALAEQPAQREPVADGLIRQYINSLVANKPDEAANATKAMVDYVYTSPQPSKPLTDREVELLDGMIEVQLDHAKRCDSIANKPMAEKQKAWDMERVELLRKLKAAHGIKGEE